MRYDPQWAAPGRRKARRSQWERRPSRRQDVPPTEPAEPDIELPTAEPASEHAGAWAEFEFSRQKQKSREALLGRAAQLWSGPDGYREHLSYERCERPLLWAATSALLHSQRSTYRERLEGHEGAAGYDAKTEKMIRDTVAVVRRRRSQLDIPFSILARSVSYFNQRTPTRVWNDQQKGLRIGVRPIPIVICPRFPRRDISVISLP